jgi:hypothetical protein
MKDKTKYTTIYIPTNMSEIYNSCIGVLKSCDANLSQFMVILIPLIIKVCTLIVKMGKNYRHFQFEIVAKDYATGQWICSNETMTIRPKIQ